MTTTENPNARTRTKLGALISRHHVDDLQPGHVVREPHTSNSEPVRRIRVGNWFAYALVFHSDQLDGSFRVVLADEMVCTPGGVLADFRVANHVTIGAALLIAEGMLRGLAAAQGVDLDPQPNPAKDPETGDWWTCSVHQGALTQDCTCTPATGLGDLGAATRAVETARSAPCLPSQDLAIAAITAYLGTRTSTEQADDGYEYMSATRGPKDQVRTAEGWELVEPAEQHDPMPMQRWRRRTGTGE